MLRPDIQWKNPVMFVVEIGAFLTLFYLVQAALGKSESQVSTGYFVALDIWLFLTVLFANFATSLAEERGKAQADSLRKTRRDTIAYRLTREDEIEKVTSRQLKPGDRVVVKAGQVVPGDGEIIQGIASIDESAITGESAAVIREAGGDRSGVTGGTLVVSDQIIIRITSGAGESFLDRMIVLVEGAIRQRTPNEIALTLKRELTVSRKPLFNRSRRVQTSRAPSSICGARNMRMQLPFCLESKLNRRRR
jgi:potassium-transporting ATPase ATP-binding subunit